MTILINASIIFSLVLGALFLAYVVAIIIPFMRRKPGRTGNPAAFEWHFMIPCRDEEAVIGETISYLEAYFPHAAVWVIDDDSDDATASIVQAAAARNPLIHLVQRRRPDARTGKAHALNHAWKIVREQIPETQRDRSILVVVDADGRPSANLFEVTAGPELFGARDVAAVQVEVRMSNRDERTPKPKRGKLANLAARTFVRMQDIEFRGPISAIQMSRKYTRTVNVGGNGQLARMSALDQIADENGPWRGSLLEDFELGLHFLLDGWKNAYTPDAWVDQEALYSLPRYLTQRARWAQGTMQCARYLKKIWMSNKLTNLGALEISYFLMQPWLQVLGTLLYPIPIIIMIINAITNPVGMTEYLQHGGSLLIIIYLVIGLGEFMVWGILYRRKSEPDASVMTAVGWGISYVLYIYLIYAVAWKAMSRLIRGKTGWAKTVRNAETVSSSELVAKYE